MALFNDVLALIPTAVSHAGASVAPEADRSIITDVVGDFSRDEVMAAIREVTAVTQEAEYIRSVLIGMAASLSTREAGHEGLAQKEGHRNTTSLIQALIGTSYTEAAKQVRVGESLVESLVSPPVPPASEPAGGGDSPEGDAGPDAEPVPCREPWHAPLGRALRDQQLTTQQHDSIMKGLGAPPRIARDSHGDPVPESSGSPAPGADDAPDAGVEPRALTREEADEVDREFIDAWSLAAETLAEEAAIRDTTELYRAAKALRDQLDPVGADKRYQERYEKRSFRIEQWRDDGLKKATWIFSDEDFLYVQAVHDAALSPRRGGVHFVDSAERARAEELSKDPRTTNQLAYDLMMDIVRAGVNADPRSVFGTRQAGVRLVRLVDAEGHHAPIVHSEDRLHTVPGGVADQQVCESGTITATVDCDGNPLNLDREQRLFSAQQRIALALRDGGCRWLDCDRPASYCEAHHIDPWKEGGKTDIDRGVLLCHFHHRQLHLDKTRITRAGTDDFVLRRPGRSPEVLPRRAALTYAWASLHHPPRRFRPDPPPRT